MEMEKKPISSYMSSKIAHMMFILSIFVVYIHANDPSYLVMGGYRLEQTLENIISQGAARVAVPLFFFMSGWLAFSKRDLSSKDLVLSFKKKIYTLLIPYLIWNVFYMGYSFLMLVLTHRLETVGSIALFVLKSVFLYECNPAFWYVLQLIGITLLTPFLLKIYQNKYASLVCLAVLLAGYLLIGSYEKNFLFPGIFFYSIGAVGTIHFRKIFDWNFYSEKWKRTVPVLASLLFVFLLLWRFWLIDLDADISYLRGTLAYRLFEFLAAIAFWFAVDVFAIGEKKVFAFEKNSFFIYASHWFVLSVLNIILKKLLPMNPIFRGCIYLAEPLVVVALILCVAVFMKKYLTGFYKTITGGR